MQNGAKNRVTGTLSAAIGRVILALALITGCGVATAAASANPPVVSGVSPTRDTTPTWSWKPGGGGNGVYRYKLDAFISGGAIETTATTFTPATPLSDGRHTLYVQESDSAGGWSVSGSKAIVIDATAPGAPQGRGVSPTKDTTPTWSWVSGGGGNGTFQYRLDSLSMAGAPVTTALTYTPATPLSDGKHTLYARERDALGNWSVLGSKAILIDTIKPGTPVVGVITPADDTTPTWSWVAGGGGSGVFRYQLDSWIMAGAPVTSELTYTSATPLSDGKHTLYVQERDGAGNWSASGQKAIVVQAPPAVLTPIPDTGQTQSYTATFGEDSDYTINPPSYADNGDGTVTDNVTNLMWQQEDDNTTRTWADALAYCPSLGLAGYSDWRLPAAGELLRIVDLGHNFPAIDPVVFPNTKSAEYWTSTAHAILPDGAWSVYLGNGNVHNHFKSESMYARCVRGGQ